MGRLSEYPKPCHNCGSDTYWQLWQDDFNLHGDDYACVKCHPPLKTKSKVYAVKYFKGEEVNNE